MKQTKYTLFCELDLHVESKQSDKDWYRTALALIVLSILKGSLPLKY